MRRTIEIIGFAIALLIAALAIHAWLASRDEQQRLKSALATQKQIIDAANADETARKITLQQTLAQIDALKRTTQTPEEILRELSKSLSLPSPITLSVPAGIPATLAVNNHEPVVPAIAQQGTGARSMTASPPAPRSEPGHSISSSIPSAPEPSPSSLLPASINASSPAPTFSSPTSAAAAETQLPALRNPNSSPSNSSPASAASAETQLPASPNTNSSALNFPSPTFSASAEIPAADLKPLYNYVQDCRACQIRLASATQNSSDEAAKIAALTRERDAAVTASKGGTLWRRFRSDALWLAVGASLGYAAHH